MAYDKSRDSFQHAIDLVKFVRRFNESGAHPHRRGFGIGVAGFPEGHPATPNRLVEMDISKQRSTPALITLSHNCFSIIATFSISGTLRARGRSHPDYRRNHADYLHPD
jgi:5,10-methylenetetrahydrofolate reductase